MADILAEIEDTGLPVDISKAGTYRAAASEAGLKSLNNYRAFLNTAGLEFQSLDRAALNSRIGSEFYQEGLYSPRLLSRPTRRRNPCAGFQPAGIGATV